ncbi:MAG: DUF222 domain-containing protein [bacterium]
MADGWRDVTEPGTGPWERLGPSPELARALAQADPQALPDDERASYLVASEQLLGWAHVVQAHALVAVADAVEAATADPAFAHTSFQESCVADEVAAALHVAPRTASWKVHAARALVQQWPELGEAVASGDLTVAQARVIADGVSALTGVRGEDGEDLATQVVRSMLHVAGTLPPARLRERVDRAVVDADAEAAARRRREATRERTDVTMWTDAEGMACLASRGPAADILALREALDARARLLRDNADPADDRTAGRWRYAALMHAFGLHPVGAAAVDLPGHAPVAAPGVEVRVVVALDTLSDLAANPGHLEGYGPLDADLARALAADSEWVRWVTDPAGGFLLDEGRRRFPGARLARFIRARESRCKHPVCGVRAKNCDADHLPAYAEGGTTSASTLSPTCPRHNRSREDSGWRVHDDGPRDPSGPPDPTWTSPLGRSYNTVSPRALANDYFPRRT